MTQTSFSSNGLNMQFSYLYSTKDRSHLENYFKLKNKYDYVLTDSEYQELQKTVVDNFGHYDLVIYPETTGKYLNSLAKAIGDNVVCIQKNDKETIIEKLFEQRMMKNEKESLLSCIKEMNESFQINKIKGNQRKRFKDILFKKVDLSAFKNKKVLLLDDSVFSGETLLALKESLNIDCDVKVIYSKF